jgi:hypothetical protein
MDVCKGRMLELEGILNRDDHNNDDILQGSRLRTRIAGIDETAKSVLYR